MAQLKTSSQRNTEKNFAAELIQINHDAPKKRTWRTIIDYTPAIAALVILIGGVSLLFYELVSPEQSVVSIAESVVPFISIVVILAAMILLFSLVGRVGRAQRRSRRHQDGLGT